MNEHPCGFQTIKESDALAKWCRAGAYILFIAIGVICFVGWLLSGCAQPAPCPDMYCAAVGAGWIKAPPEQ